MAELGTMPQTRSAQPAINQLRAIAWLRWRILANGFRRKGGAGELIARILLIPLFAIIALIPIFLSGLAAWYFARYGQYNRLAWVLWAATGLAQLLNINLGQPGTTFDPIELIRFPLPLRRYVLVRLGFGLLSPGNLIITLMSVAVVVGVAVARLSLLLPASVAMLVFALTNVLFTRMVFAWVDRWLSTRRAREVFTALIFLFSMSIQFVNVNFNPAFQHGRHRRAQRSPSALLSTGRRIHPYVRWLPPELSAASIVAASRGDLGLFLDETAACAGFGLLFLAAYSLRMRTEYRGENLSDVANATRTPTSSSVPRPAVAPLATARLASPATPLARGPLPSSLFPLLGKELLTLRRNVGIFYGLVAPAVMVFLFAGRMSARNSSHWVLLGAVAYALLGIAPMSYNCFGAEGTGAQTYFFVPVPLREVFFAKNIFGFLIALFEVVVVVSIVTYVAGEPTLADCLFALLWACATLLISTTLGNLRSVSAPKKIKQGAGMNRAQSSVSAYISMGVLLGCAALGAGCEFMALYLHSSWLGLLLMTAFAVAGVIVYANGLKGIESYALQHRDTLFEELGKKV